ncbi:MAG: hypothetical protein JKY65_17240 [Planctomycetes bacterium]|nr:hypothetical protein [Planctomycetota bacterium]
MIASDKRKRLITYTVLGVGVCVGIGLLLAAQGLVDRKLEAKVYGYPHRTLEYLGKAQVRFQRSDRDEDGLRDFAGSLQELGDGRCITEDLASGDVGRYHYFVVPPVVSHGWAFRADPAEVTTSALFYYMDQTFQVRAQAGRPASASSLVFYDPLDGLTGTYPLPKSTTQPENLHAMPEPSRTP